MKDDLPLWRVADAQARRAGLEPVPSPAVAPAPKKARAPRRKRPAPAVWRASVSALPLWRNRPVMARWTDELLTLPPGDTRMARLDRKLERLAADRRALGLSDGWIIAERAGIRETLNAIVRERFGFGHGPEGGAA
ncbi:hypothetical protein ACTZWW_03090 [Salinarimonas sp. NSM]|uniref:hypothetical protein n=1 Tax=Salinarimonas sp. NSM TaxID=3458003 RepID=UPI00403731AD